MLQYDVVHTPDIQPSFARAWKTLLTMESQWSDFKLEADGRPVMDGVSSNGQEVADENDAGTTSAV